jgi:hypothetical protein
MFEDSKKARRKKKSKTFCHISCVLHVGRGFWEVNVKVSKEKFNRGKFILQRNGLAKTHASRLVFDIMLARRRACRISTSRRMISIVMPHFASFTYLNRRHLNCFSGCPSSVLKCPLSTSTRLLIMMAGPAYAVLRRLDRRRV